MTIIIPGFTPDDKVPGTVFINRFGVGPTSIGANTLFCVLFGNKGSSGTADLNDRTLVTTEEEADILAEPRSELARMAHAALEVPGVTCLIVPVEEAAGAVAAVMIIDVTGSWTVSGEVTLQLDEEVIRVTVAASHTATTFGDALEDAINAAQGGRLFCTASNSAGRITLTVFSKGIRGNQHIAFLDASKRPSGMTIAFDVNTDVVRTGSGPANGVTITGTPTADIDGRITITTGGAPGTAEFSWYTDGGTTPVATGVSIPTTPFQVVLGSTGLTATFINDTYVMGDTYDWLSEAPEANGGSYFYGGTGTDDIQDALDGTESVANDYLAAAHNDATNVGKIETAANAKGAFDVALLEQYQVSSNAPLATAQSLSQTTMNDVLGTVAWVQNGVEHPSRVAARIAALRSVTEGAQPNTNYDGVVVPGGAPHFRAADSPNRATLKAALNVGLTPLATVDGKLVIVKAVLSRCLNGATPDYRTHEWADAAVPIRVRKELAALGEEMREANPYAGPDVGEGLPPADTFTPRLWASAVTAKMKRWESSAFNWVTEVDSHPVQAVWDSVAKRVMSDIPVVVKQKNHQTGGVISQTAPSV